MQGIESSGFVEVCKADIEIASEALEEEANLHLIRSGFKMNDADRALHEATGLWIEAWRRQFVDMVPGRVHFARSDMERLRGIFFSGYKVRLVQRLRLASSGRGRNLPLLGARLQQTEEFERRMYDPEPFSGSVVCFERAVASRFLRRA